MTQTSDSAYRYVSVRMAPPRRGLYVLKEDTIDSLREIMMWSLPLLEFSGETTKKTQDDYFFFVLLKIDMLSTAM